MNQEGQEIFDLKSLTKEEVAWLEEHFIDFAREQYLVRWDDMKEAQRQKELQRSKIQSGIRKMVKIIERAKNRKVACQKQESGVPIGSR